MKYKVQRRLFLNTSLVFYGCGYGGWVMQQEAPAPAGQQAAQILAERKGDSRHKNPGTIILNNCLWHGREDLMIFRGQGFFAVKRFGSSPTPSPLYLSLFPCVAGRVYWREEGGRGGGRVAEWDDSKKTWPSINWSILSDCTDGRQKRIKRGKSRDRFLTYWSRSFVFFCLYLKVHKIEIFFGFDFEICIISLLVMSKY